jgi:hypothetical protein
MILTLAIIAQAVEDQVFFKHLKEGSSSKTFISYHRHFQKASVKILGQLAMVIVRNIIRL